LKVAFAYPTQLMSLMVLFGDLVEPELSILAGQLGPGRVAVDVGASIGTWTLCAAQTGARVHACEPDPENLKMLERNIGSNDLQDRVLLHPVALGAADGRSRLSQHGRRFMTSVQLATEESDRSDQPIYSLATFADGIGLGHIDVLKINTAGSEVDVLRGARPLFESAQIGVALVLDGIRVRPLLDELGKLSYQLGFYDGDNRRFVTVADSTQLDRARPSPMNRYVLVKHSGVDL
jgi:FkbM family methyltransferase